MTVAALGRAFELYRRTATSRSAIVLLVANAIPVIGVLFFGWSLLTILVVYWLENGIIGFWNVPKILMAQGSVIPRLPDLPAAAARAATGSGEQAAALQAAWRQAQIAQAAALAGGSEPVSAALPSAASEPTAASQPTSASRPGSVAQPTSPATAALGSPSSPPSPPVPTFPAGIRVVGTPGLSNPFARFSAVPRIGLAIFFAFHYGMFWFVHGIFVFALPAFGGFETSGPGLDGTAPPGADLPGMLPGFEPCGNGAFGEVLWGAVALAAVALFISHGASFLFNYLGRGEYLTASPARQMGAPYARVIVLHLTIIFGSMVVAFLGAPIGALLVLVGLKTAFDLNLHLRERRAADERLPGALAATA